ncbi:hypothetical protein SUGI_0000660 [Cryptomeria japonica]|uniref:F-box/kelch-repeat protein At1g80440 n=1 Tax=Cryptomeria japonica TaxID=3369 RepID=UPI002408C6BC|nr:F-box/kelch-repeat protein At1g80440 [Cryptomeria japonica]GLJ04651.1 hypothetical protein SUGI_0000660 [Cryptomeria japonica]
MEIFPRLPEEVGRECLLRVSFRSHSTLRAVCKSWQAVVDSPCFNQDRKRSATSEQCVFFIQALPAPADSVIEKAHRVPTYALTLYDPLQCLWQRQTPPFPELSDGIPLFSECIAVKNKVILIGGWHPARWEAIKSVFVLDVSSGRWSRGANMPTVRSFFACSVSPSDGLLYVAGGHDENKRALRGAAVYDVGQDKWESLPDMMEARDESRGAFVDGKFYVISGYESEAQGRFKQSAQVYDPNTGLWSSLQNMWPNWGCPRSCSCISAFGGVLAFYRGGVLSYDSKGNEWQQIGALPSGLECVRGAAVWRDRIFVTGSQVGRTAQSCYLFEPPSFNGGKGEMGCGKWIPLERPQNFAGIVQSVATLEI